MYESTYESEMAVRQLFSGISQSLLASEESVDNAYKAFILPHMDGTPSGVAQAIFAIYDYSYEVLSQYQTFQYNIDDEILEPLRNLGEEIAQYDNISVAQQAVEEWVHNNTEC